jgi:argininosuccinate lyase
MGARAGAAEEDDHVQARASITARSDHDTLRDLNRDYIRSVQTSDVRRFDEILADDFQAFTGVAGRPPRLPEEDLRRYTTPEHFVAVRTLPGGPAPGPLQASLARYRRELDAARAWLEDYRARIEGVDRRLAERTQALASG